jgi:hypothetical protein
MGAATHYKPRAKRLFAGDFHVASRGDPLKFLTESKKTLDSTGFLAFRPIHEEKKTR